MEIISNKKYFIISLLLFLISIHIKIDNVATIYPFRLLVLSLAIISLLVFIKSTFLDRSFLIKEKYLSMILFYLLIYPVMQSFIFGQLGRSLKDNIYMTSIWGSLILLVLFYIKNVEGLSKIYFYSSLLAILTLPFTGLFNNIFLDLKNIQIEKYFIYLNSYAGRLYGLMGTPTHLSHLLLFAALLSVYIIPKNIGFIIYA